MRTKRKPIIGYRTMTGAQRYNARMERIWDEYREREAAKQQDAQVEAQAQAQTTTASK